MSTGTIQNAALLVINTKRSDVLQFTFLNSQGAVLSPGDEVYLHTDGTVKLRSLGSQRPLGVVVVGGDNDVRVTVRTYFTMVMDVVNNSAGSINAGVMVVPEGTKDANDVPQYIAAIATNMSSAMTLVVSADQAVMRVGIFDSIITV